MKRGALSFLLLATLAGTIGCSGIVVDADYDPGVNFRAMKSFSIMERPSRDRDRDRDRDRGRSAGPITMKRIEDAVRRELTAKGFVEKLGGKPDFRVAAHVTTKERIEVDHWGYAYGRYGRWRSGYTTVTKLNEANVVIDVVDTETRDLAWRGWGRVIIEPGERAGQLDETVTKILAQFPPSRG
ncbi:MAG: DUF4136 domain-containing protein [Acidobacteria bacterium]|nr:DUF4136 domain-containing protein [Acidobacteriota bacterium]